MAIRLNREDVQPETSEEARTWRFFRRTDELGIGMGIAEFGVLPESIDPADRCEAHDVPEVHYVLSGRGIALEDGEEIELRAGDALVTLPGIRHTLWSTGEDPLVTVYVAIQGTGTL